MAVVDNGWESHPANLVQATYAYLSSGENQLSFHEGDTIAITGKCRYVQKLIYSLITTYNIHIIGERNKGWQFGENLRTQCSGWFPLTYTEPVVEDSVFSYVYSIKTANSSMNLLYITIFIFRDSPSSYRRKDSVGQSTISTHNRSESATIGKQNRYQTTTLTRFGDSLSHRNPYPVSPLSNATCTYAVI